MPGLTVTKFLKTSVKEKFLKVVRDKKTSLTEKQHKNNSRFITINNASKKMVEQYI